MQICIKIVWIDWLIANEDLIHFSADFKMVIKDVIFLTWKIKTKNTLCGGIRVFNTTHKWLFCKENSEMALQMQHTLQVEQFFKFFKF